MSNSFQKFGSFLFHAVVAASHDRCESKEQERKEMDIKCGCFTRQNLVKSKPDGSLIICLPIAFNTQRISPHLSSGPKVGATSETSRCDKSVRYSDRSFQNLGHSIMKWTTSSRIDRLQMVQRISATAPRLARSSTNGWRMWKGVPVADGEEGIEDCFCCCC